MAGSIADSFTMVQPTYVLCSVKLRDSFLCGLPEFLLPGSGGHKESLSTCIDNHLPVVAAMMENGRMASIACATLTNHPEDIPIVEATLVAMIATKFMKSNGLQQLVKDRERRYRVASAAIAVHLFQEGSQGSQPRRFPKSKKEYEQKVQAMDVALMLANDAKGPGQDDFLPFCVDKGFLLGGLLQKLASQRKKRERIRNFAVGCYTKGEVVRNRSGVMVLDK